MSTLRRVTRYAFPLSAFLGVAVIALVARKAHAAADTLKVPLAGEDSTQCVPLGTYVSGHLEITTKATFDTRGTHLIVMINSAGAKLIVPTASGPVEFVSNESHEHELNATVGAAFEYSDDDYFRFTSTNTRQSYRCRIHMHVTINANGELTADVEDILIDCEVPCCDPDPDLLP
jgi:hypothetical protein